MSAVDAVRKTCEETSSNLRHGRPRSSNLVMGSHSGEDDFRKMDKRVNSYPDIRYFTAIGTGGSQFAQSMREATEKVLGHIHEECVVETSSSKGKYVSVRVGPVTVMSSDQVIQVYSNMRNDPRLKMYL